MLVVPLANAIIISSKKWNSVEPKIFRTYPKKGIIDVFDIVIFAM